MAEADIPLTVDLGVKDDASRMIRAELRKLQKTPFLANGAEERKAPTGEEPPSTVIVTRPDGTREVQALIGDKFHHLLRASELDDIDRSKPPVVSYKLSMYCISRGTSSKDILHLWRYPTTIFDLKEQIQKRFQIPYSFHILRYKGKEPSNEKKVKDLGIANGDTFDLSYLSEGELDKTKVGVSWYTFISNFTRFRHPSIFAGATSEINLIISMGVKEFIAEKLIQECLLPWDSDVAYANRVYFLQQDALKIVMRVYHLLLSETWRNTHHRMKMIEANTILVLAAVASNNSFRDKIMKEDGFGCVMKSFLRVHIDRGSPVIDNSGAPGWPTHNNFMLKEIFDSCLEFLLCFREHRDCLVDMCSNDEIVEQLVSIMHSPSFTIQQVQGVMCMFACCVQSADTHQWLSKDSTLLGVIDTVRFRKENIGDNDPTDLMVLHYYAQVTIAHMVISSSRYLSRKLREKFISFMEDFFDTASVDEIAKIEKSSPRPGLGWATYMPTVRLIYTSPSEGDATGTGPTKIVREGHLLEQLKELSFESALFALEMMVTKDPERARKKLLEEKILSYTLCVPANVPVRGLPRANRVVVKLREGVKVPLLIPKLSLMARARLAKTHFGLKRVMDRTVDDIKLEIRPTPASLAPKPHDARSFPDNKSLLYIIAI